MANTNPNKRDSLSQSVSQSKDATSAIVVQDYEEYQQQQQKARNVPSSKDDLMLATFGKSGKKRRFSMLPGKGKGSVRHTFTSGTHGHSTQDVTGGSTRNAFARNTSKRSSFKGVKGRSKASISIPSNSGSINQRQFTPPLTAMTAIAMKSPSNSVLSTHMNFNPLARPMQPLNQTQSYQSSASESTPHLFTKAQPASPLPNSMQNVMSNDSSLRKKQSRHKSTASATITVTNTSKRRPFTKPRLNINALSADEDASTVRPWSSRSASNFDSDADQQRPRRPQSQRLSSDRRSVSHTQLVGDENGRRSTLHRLQSSTPPVTSSHPMSTFNGNDDHNNIMSPVMLPLPNSKGVTFSPSLSGRGQNVQNGQNQNGGNGGRPSFLRRQSRSKSDVHKYKSNVFPFGVSSQTDSDIEPESSVNVNYSIRPQHSRHGQRPLSATLHGAPSYFDSTPRLSGNGIHSNPTMNKSRNNTSGGGGDSVYTFTSLNAGSTPNKSGKRRTESLTNTTKAMKLLTTDPSTLNASRSRSRLNQNAHDQTPDPMNNQNNKGFQIPDLSELNAKMSNDAITDSDSSDDPQSTVRMTTSGVGNAGDRELSVRHGVSRNDGGINGIPTPSEQRNSGKDVLNDNNGPKNKKKKKHNAMQRAQTDFVATQNAKGSTFNNFAMQRPGTFHHSKSTNKSKATMKRERAEQQQREREERKRAEEEEARLRQIERKKNLERDLDNFQYDRWNKNKITQTFSLPALEAAFKKYHQHHHVVLIKIYIIGAFVIYIAIFAFYEVPSMDYEHQELYALLSLFNLSLILLFLAIFGFMFWSKRLIECQSEAMILFNLAIALNTLISSALGGEPGYGAYIIIMFCIHLFCGMRHQIASALCWFIAFAFAIMSAVLTSLTVRGEFEESQDIAQIYWSNFAEQVAYLWFTALCLSIMGIHMEFSARRQFYQRKKLQHEKKKSWRALSTLLPPDVAKSLQDGKRVAVAFKYEPNHPRFKGVTVGFVQICAFHELVSKLPSSDLVRMLNNIFTKWDEFASLHRVFKVETINEVYMVAGGLPYPKIEGTGTLAHPIRMVFFANDLMNYCSEVLQVEVPEQGHSEAESKDEEREYEEVSPTRPHALKRIESVTTPDIDQLPHSFKKMQRTQTLQIRIGLNIGYVVAGVIGKQLPRYRLFGDTVNTASRMESTCGPSQIQMTQKFHNELPETFHQYTEKREDVQVKGKGLMTTYLLKKIDRDNHKLNASTMSQSQIASSSGSLVEEQGELIRKESLDKSSAMTATKTSIEIPVLQPIPENISGTNSGIQMHKPGGLMGLLTLVEDDEPSINDSIHSRELSLNQSPDLSLNITNLQIPGLGTNSIQLNPQSRAAPDTPQSGLIPTNSNHGDSNNINIRIDPPSVLNMNGDRIKSQKLEPLRESLHSADGDSAEKTDSLRSQYRSSRQKSLRSKAKHRRNRTAMNRKLKLIASRRNIFDDKHGGSGSDLAVRFMEDHYRQSSLKERLRPQRGGRPKLSRAIASSRDLRDHYQGHRQRIRRNQSLRNIHGLLSMPVKRESLQKKKESELKRRRMQKQKGNEIMDKRRGLMADIVEEELHGLPTRTPSIHARSRSQGQGASNYDVLKDLNEDLNATPFEPILSKSNSFIKTPKVSKIDIKRHSMMAEIPTQSRTPTADDIKKSTKRSRPHKYALKHKMTKLSHQRVSPHSNSPSNNGKETMSPRAHLHAATVGERIKFRNSDLHRRRKGSKRSVMSGTASADNEEEAEDANDDDDGDFSTHSSADIASTVTDDMNEDRGFMSDPGTDFRSSHRQNAMEQKVESKALVVDSIDDDEYDSPRNGAFVGLDRADSEDLFKTENIDDFDTDSDAVQPFAHNGGRITPPALSTPSGQSSEVTPFSSPGDAAKRISSVQPNLKSVPETHSEKTDSNL